MKESYREGVANHSDPESCTGDGNTSGEALTGAHTGQLSSSEITSSACRPSGLQGKAISVTPLKREVTQDAAESKNLSMCENSMHENLETPSVPRVDDLGRSEKGDHTADMHADGESDDSIVPMKQAHKGSILIGPVGTPMATEVCERRRDHRPLRRRLRHGFPIPGRRRAVPSRTARAPAKVRSGTAPGKTRMIEFGRFAAENRKRRGDGKPETFDFLGFTHCCGHTRRGKFKITRITIAKRMRATLHAIKEKFRKLMHAPIHIQGQWLRSVIQGWLNYYAVPGNYEHLARFCDQMKRLWLWTLRRRSHKARNRWPWARIRLHIKRWFPKVQILHPYPEARLRT